MSPIATLPALCVIVMVGGACSAFSTRDISHEPEFAAMIGREYRIVGDVDAYGVKDDLQDTNASYATLIPRPPGIGGPEVAFRRQLPRGQTFRIRAARSGFVLFETGIEYVVELHQSTLPQGIEVRLALMRGNETDDVESNPRIYQRVQ